MHENHTRRALHMNSQTGAVRALALAVVVLLPPAAAQAAASDDGAITSSLGRGAPHELRISLTKPGLEGIELSARLEENGGLINRPIDWSVKDAGGMSVFEAETAIAAFKAVPGDYRIKLQYGTITVERQLALMKGQQVGVTFTLNAGGVRVLPRVNGVGLSELAPETDIFQGGVRVARSTLPGEIVRVGAGAYRIVSRFAHGNSEATSDIVVKPGKLNALTFDHKAGVAKLLLANGVGEATWHVTGAGGESLSAAKGSSAVFVLKPGSYSAEVETNGERFKKNFTIGLGETLEVVLGD